MDEQGRSFAELAVEQGLATTEQVAECVEAVREAAELGAAARLPDTLVAKAQAARR